MSTALVTLPQARASFARRQSSDVGSQQKRLLLQMVQGQLDDSTEFGDTLEHQKEIRALQTELAEVKQADDEELDRLLDQNAELQLTAAEAHAAHTQAVQAVKAAGQKVAQLETANAELRVSTRQLQQAAEASNQQHAKEVAAAKQEAQAAQQAVQASQAQQQKVQSACDQAVSKLSLMEMQMVELKAKRLEDLQACDAAKQVAAQLSTQLGVSRSQCAAATTSYKKADDAAKQQAEKLNLLEQSLAASDAIVQKDKEVIQKDKELLQKQKDALQQSQQLHKDEVQQLHKSLQAAKQDLEASKAETESARAAHLAAVEKMRIQNQRQLSRLMAANSSAAEPSSTLAVVPAQQAAGQDEASAGLAQEVGALTGLLATVAPQLQELAGMKQQMAQLMALLPGKASDIGAVTLVALDSAQAPLLQPPTSGRQQTSTGPDGGAGLSQPALVAEAMTDDGAIPASAQPSEGTRPSSSIAPAVVTAVMQPALCAGPSSSTAPVMPTTAVAQAALQLGKASAEAAKPAQPDQSGNKAGPSSADAAQPALQNAVAPVLAPSQQPPLNPGIAVESQALRAVGTAPSATTSPAAALSKAVPQSRGVMPAGPAAAATGPEAVANGPRGASQTSVLAPVAAPTAAVRPVSKRKWDAMTREEPANANAAAAVGSQAAAAAAAPVAAVPAPPAVSAAADAAVSQPGSSAFALPQTAVPPSAKAGVPLSSSAAASTSLAAASKAHVPSKEAGTASRPASSDAATLPMSSSLSGSLPMPASTAGLVQFTQPAVAEAVQAMVLSPASALMKTGKEAASRLAAEFAQQYRSNQTLAPKTLPVSTVAPPVVLSQAAKVAASAAADKLMQEQALKAHRHLQANTNDQSVHHVVRMEALRLRNMARHHPPQPVTLSTPAVPLPPPPAAAPAVVPGHSETPALAAAAAASQSAAAAVARSHEGAAQGSLTPLRGKDCKRKHNQKLMWETEQLPDVSGAPAEFVARGSSNSGRNSPASIGSGQQLSRRQRQKQATAQSPAAMTSRGRPDTREDSPQGRTARHSPSKRARQSPKGRSIQSPKGRSMQSPRGRSMQSPRGRSIQSPRGRSNKSPRGRGASGSSQQGRSPIEPSDRATHRRTDMTDHGQAEQSIQAERRRASFGAHQRQHSTNARQSASRQNSPVQQDGRQSQSGSPIRETAASQQDEGRRAAFSRAGQLQPAPRTASPLGRASSSAAGNPRVAADPIAATAPQAEDADSVIMEVDEEAEEGELRSGERAASVNREEDGRFAGEPEGPQEPGANQVPKASQPASAASSQADLDRASPADEFSPIRDPTASPQGPGLSPAPQSGYHSSGTPAAAVEPAAKAAKATSGAVSQSTVSQGRISQAATSSQAHEADSHPPTKRSRLSNADVPVKSSAIKSGSIGGGAKSTDTVPVNATKAGTQQTAEGGTGGGHQQHPPRPPPGSPTASSKTQEVVPPPPPTAPPPPAAMPQLQSPSSSRTQPAAVAKQAASASQAAAPSAKPTGNPGGKTSMQQPQPLMPAGGFPKMPASNILHSRPVTDFPRTYTEQQHPPQVQLPAAAAARSYEGERQVHHARLNQQQQQQQQQQPAALHQQSLVLQQQQQQLQQQQQQQHMRAQLDQSYNHQVHAQQLADALAQSARAASQQQQQVAAGQGMFQQRQGQLPSQQGPFQADTANLAVQHALQHAYGQPQGQLQTLHSEPAQQPARPAERPPWQFQNSAVLLQSQFGPQQQAHMQQNPFAALLPGNAQQQASAPGVGQGSGSTMQGLLADRQQVLAMQHQGIGQHHTQSTNIPGFVQSQSPSSLGPTHFGLQTGSIQPQVMQSDMLPWHMRR